MKFKQFCGRCLDNDNFTRYLSKICKEIDKDVKFQSYTEHFCQLGVSSAQAFEQSFREMCDALFQYGVKVEYIAMLIAFSCQLDSRMQVYEWYETDLLINLLRDILKEVNFNPNGRAKVWDDYCYSMFLVIVPMLLFCYYCF